jgi:Tetratricopeptide repeat
MYKHALQRKEKVLGLKHISTLNMVNNLSLFYVKQGKLGKAKKIFKHILQGYEKALGLEHILTLNMVNNLGLLYTN